MTWAQLFDRADGYAVTEAEISDAVDRLRRDDE